MSLDFPAANITSAQINAQARYAPSTDTSRPTLTNTEPQGPTTDSSTPAIDGWRIPAMSARCSTAYGSSVTSTMSPVTPTKPTIVAQPTSVRFFA